MDYLLQVANGHEDHKYWGRPEQMTMARPAYAITADKPGSDLAGETAAALAAGSIAFRKKGYLNLPLRDAFESFVDTMFLLSSDIAYDIAYEGLKLSSSYSGSL